MSRFLCVGDLHLDKGGRYGRVPGERLAEQETVWAHVLELAREHDVDAVLFAGDAFEKRHPSTDAMLAFERPLVEHRAQDGPRVLAIPGNHDRSGTSDYCALDVFAEAGLLRLEDRPMVQSEVGLGIAYLPWTPVSRIVAANDGGDRDDVNATAALLLLDAARGLREMTLGPAILLTHFSISGAVTPDGADVGLFREPVLPLADLEVLGFDAIVAGHIHRPQLLTAELGGGPVFYTGSPMPLDFGEGKCEHGVWLLDTEAVQGSVETRFLPIESRPFVTLDGGVDDDTIHPFEEVQGAYVKIRLAGSEEDFRHYDLDGLRSALIHEGGARNLWVELTIERETRARVAGLDEQVSDVDAFDAWLEAVSIPGDQAPALRVRHAEILEATR